MAEPETPEALQSRDIAMLEAISRSLSVALSLPEAIASIAEASSHFIRFERMAILRREGEGLRVHAVANPATWNEGRVIQRSECSDRLWIEPGTIDVVRDTSVELDPAFSMDREIIERGHRSIVRVPLPGRDGPI